MTGRAHITLKTKLAAAVCIIFGIPHEHAKAMTEDQVLSLAEWHHYPIPKAADGPDVHWNLTPIAKVPHRERSKIDTAERTKGRHITAANEEFRRRMLAKDTGEPVIERKSRRWAKRRMQSRNDLRRTK